MSEVDILGTRYKFIVVKDEDFPISRDGGDGGVTKFEEKEIIVNKDTDCLNDLNRIVRHEIIHAFLYECGLREYTDNELLVDFLAYQIPKMVKIFKEIEFKCEEDVNARQI